MNHMQNSQEIHEAIRAADDALIALRRAEESLSSAGNWGLWDMLGGGFFSTLVKHNKIDQAQGELREAQAALAHFRDELADVGRIVSFDLDTGGFLRFADYFFDDFFSDVLVQSKISRGKQKLRQAIGQVEEIRRVLWDALG